VQDPPAEERVVLVEKGASREAKVGTAGGKEGVEDSEVA